MSPDLFMILFCSFRVAGKEKEIASLQNELACQRNAFEQQRKKNNVRKLFPLYIQTAAFPETCMHGVPQFLGCSAKRIFLTLVSHIVSSGRSSFFFFLGVSKDPLCLGSLIITCWIDEREETSCSSSQPWVQPCQPRSEAQPFPRG